MKNVFVILEHDTENSPELPTMFPQAYTTFELAKDAIKSKHQHDLEEQTTSQDALTELKQKNPYSYFYVEKGIHIYIWKLPVTNQIGGKKSQQKTNKKTNKGKTRKIKKTRPL